MQHGISYGAFAEIAKRAFVDVAEKDFRLDGRKQTVSRISIVTGLTRKEVQRLTHLGDGEDHEAIEKYNRSARVIGGWIRDKRFADKRGQPASLVFEDDPNSFSELVKSYSGDMPPRALLDELIRVGAVERLKDGRMHLITRAYLPRSGEAEKVDILGADVAELIATIEYNLDHEMEDAWFQRKVAYDNLPDKAVPKLRRYSAKRAQKFLELLDKQMAESDRDANADVEGEGRNRIVMGVYYFEESVPEDD